METTSMTSTFIVGPVREVKVENHISKTSPPSLKLPPTQKLPPSLKLRRDSLRSFAGAPSRSPRWRVKAGDPGLIRTADLRFRKPMLYPSELRGHSFNFTGFHERRFRKPMYDSRSGPWRAGGHLSYGATASILRDSTSVGFGNRWSILDPALGGPGAI